MGSGTAGATGRPAAFKHYVCRMVKDTVGVEVEGTQDPVLGLEGHGMRCILPHTNHHLSDIEACRNVA